jgi:hypothetical protein
VKPVSTVLLEQAGDPGTPAAGTDQADFDPGFGGGILAAGRKRVKNRGG